MSDFLKFNKNIEKQKFVNFLIEKQVDPHDLITFSIKLKKINTINEEKLPRLSGIQKSGFLSALGGGLRGLYHGFRAGMGTRSIKKATDILKSQLNLAYEKFLDTLIELTGNEITAVRLVSMLRNNAYHDIDARIYGIGQPLGEIEELPQKKLKPSPGKDIPTSDSEEVPEEPPPSAPIPKPKPDTPAKPKPSETGSGEEEPESGSEYTSVDPDQAEIDVFEREFKDKIGNDEISYIVDLINNDFADDRYLSIYGLIQLMNNHSDDDELLLKCAEIIKDVQNQYTEMSRRDLSDKIYEFWIDKLSPAVQAVVLPKSSVDELGKQLILATNVKIDMIQNGEAKKYICDVAKIEEDDDLTFFTNLPETLKVLDPSGDKITKKIVNKKITDPDVFIYVIFDDSNNYAEIKKPDMQKIQQNIIRKLRSN